MASGTRPGQPAYDPTRVGQPSDDSAQPVAGSPVERVDAPAPRRAEVDGPASRHAEVDEPVTPAGEDRYPAAETDTGDVQIDFEEAETEEEEPRPRLEDLGRRAWALVGIGLVAGIVVYLLSRLAWLFAPAAVTVILAVIAAPIVSAFAPGGRGRTLATVGVFVALVAVIGGAVWLVGPAFTRQIARLTIDVPEVAAGLADRLEEFEDRLQDPSPAAARAVAQFNESLVERSESFGADLARSIFGVVGSILGFVVALLIGAVVAFMIVKDLPGLTSRMRAWMDRPENLRARGALVSMGRATTSFVRGQLLVAVIVGVLKTLVLWLLGIPYFVPLGVLSGVGNLVPGIGPAAAAIPAVLIALAQGGWWLALGTALALGIVQVADIYWFSPWLVGSKTRLPTLVIIVAMIIGAGLFGFGGLIVSVPVAAAAKEGIHWLLVPEAELPAQLDELEKTWRQRRVESRARRGLASRDPGGRNPVGRQPEGS